MSPPPNWAFWPWNWGAASPPDGTQTHLWDPDQVPLPGYQYSEEYDTAWWDSEGQTCDGSWLRCLSGYDDQGQLVYSYINVQTGEVTGAVPDGYFQERDEAGRGYTWEGDTMTVYADDGQTYTIDTTGLGNYCQINGDRILFSWSRADTGLYSSITDLSGKVIFQYPGRSLSFVSTNRSETSLICYQPDYSQEQTVVLTRNGVAVASGVSGSVRQWGDRLLFADAASYRLTDLAGSDLIRLPRLSYQAD